MWLHLLRIVQNQVTVKSQQRKKDSRSISAVITYDVCMVSENICIVIVGVGHVLPLVLSHGDPWGMAT